MTAQTAQNPGLTAAAPVYNVAGAADTFAAQPGANYLLHIKNGNAAPCAVVLDDPTAQTPVGATAFNPDVTYSVPATTGERVVKINSDRFRDASGNVNLTFTPNATVTYAIYGPL